MFERAWEVMHNDLIFSLPIPDWALDLEMKKKINKEYKPIAPSCSSNTAWEHLSGSNYPRKES
jgi:hypothetical protein